MWLQGALQGEKHTRIEKEAEIEDESNRKLIVR